ncbi:MULTISPECIES: hypothetical protein [unclassified Bradyrhizobium]|uniref:hypothetical protein n=1 Tax=unclassified Bradyrhizobium TaxID=2631580 RepID=UPI0023055D83|nr:hypothetical protein [Bradyrhizobium sp. CCBAU 21359]
MFGSALQQNAPCWRVDAIGVQGSLCGGKMILEIMERRDVPALHDAAVDPYAMRIETKYFAWAGRIRVSEPPRRA